MSSLYDLLAIQRLPVTATCLRSRLELRLTLSKSCGNPLGNYVMLTTLGQFRYYQLEEDELGLSDSEFENPDLPLQVDPFFAECRAFGRIIEHGENGLLAVECFGHLYVPAEREKELLKKFEIIDWGRPDQEYEQQASQRQPLRAIVKKFVSGETKWNSKTSKKILSNLKALNAIGIYVFDVRAHNMICGHFVDFSASMVEPHILFETRDREEVASRRKRDLNMFDVMMEEQQVKNAPRALPNARYVKKLRSAPVHH